MASTISYASLKTLSPRRVSNTHPLSCKATKLAQPAMPCRRQLLVLLTATTVMKAVELPSRGQDVPLFGLRKKLKKAEEDAEEIVKEGFEAADKGIEAVGKGIVTAKKGIESAELGIEAAKQEIESEVSFGGLAQAGAVAGAEFVGILIATSIVNGILGPEALKS